MVEVIPGINEKSFDEVSRKLELVIGSVPWVHIDIEDNTLVDIVTYNNPASFKAYASRIQLEAHLMVSDPQKYVKPFVDAGFRRLIAHVEGDTIREFVDTACGYQVEVGVALDGPSRLELVEPFLDEVDCVLVMTGNIGPSGTPFLQETLPKIRVIHEEYKDLPIAVDIGITKETAPLAIENGASRLVSTTYLFKEPEFFHDRLEELESL